MSLRCIVHKLLIWLLVGNQLWSSRTSCITFAVSSAWRDPAEPTCWWRAVPRGTFVLTTGLLSGLPAHSCLVPPPRAGCVHTHSCIVLGWTAASWWSHTSHTLFWLFYIMLNKQFFSKPARFKGRRRDQVDAKVFQSGSRQVQTGSSYLNVGREPSWRLKQSCICDVHTQPRLLEMSFLFRSS